MRKVIVFGTFDILHEGHKNLFKQAKEFGDFLVVVVARDKNVLRLKGTLPINNQLKRLKKLQQNDDVDRAVLGNKDDRYLIIKEQQPDVICLGYDQKVNKKGLQKKLKEYSMNKVSVIYLKAYKPNIYKSSKLKVLLGK